MMQKIWLFLVLSAGLFGCQPNLEAISAGHIGCVPADVEVSDYETSGMNAASWTATCGHRVFSCSGAGNTVSCTPLAGDSSASN